MEKSNIEENKTRKVRYVNSMKKPKQENKEFYWMIGVMVGLILIFIFFSSVFQGLNKFDYQGLEFTKEKFSENIYVYHHAYQFTYGKQTYEYNLFLRNDPRKNEVPVVGGEEIYLASIKPVYVSINGKNLAGKCEQASIAVAGLAAFLKGNMLDVKSATPNIIEAQANNLTYADCDNTNGGQVIIVTDGSETKIEKVSSNCYIISAANCEILSATEKFIVQSIVDAKERQALRGLG